MNICLKYLENIDFRDRLVKIPVIRRNIFIHQNNFRCFLIISLVRNVYQYISEVTDTCINCSSQNARENWRNTDGVWFPSQHPLTSLIAISGANGDQWKKNRENSGKFTTLKNDKSWIDYKALTKIGLPVNIY